MNAARLALLLLNALAIAPMIGCYGAGDDGDDGVRSGRFWFQGEQRELKYRQIGDYKIFEGDIILDPRTQIASSSGELGRTEQAIVARGSAKLWDGPDNGGKGVIPVAIDKSITKPERVKAAMAQWEAKTSIRFVTYDSSKHTSWVQVVNANTRAARYQNACWASIGRTGGRQEIILDEDICTPGLIAHEFGHTLGLLHEHTRSDRDAYVTHFAASTLPAYQSQYDIRRCADGGTACDKKYGDYDVNSIMHYASTYFSNGKINASGHSWTLAAKKADGTYGRIFFSGVLSPKDIAGIERLYGFSGTAPAPDPTDTTPDPEPTKPTEPPIKVAEIPPTVAQPEPIAPAQPTARAEPAAAADDLPSAAASCTVGRPRSTSLAMGVLVALAVAVRRRRAR